MGPDGSQYSRQDFSAERYGGNVSYDFCDISLDASQHGISLFSKREERHRGGQKVTEQNEWAEEELVT